MYVAEVVDQIRRSAQIGLGKVLILDLGRGSVYSRGWDYVARKGLASRGVSNRLGKLGEVTGAQLQIRHAPLQEYARRNLQIKIRHVEERLVFDNRTRKSDLSPVFFRRRLDGVEEVAGIQCGVEMGEISLAMKTIIAALGDHVVVGDPGLIGRVAHAGHGEFAEIQAVHQINRAIVRYSVHSQGDLRRRLAVDIHVPTAALTLDAGQCGEHGMRVVVANHGAVVIGLASDARGDLGAVGGNRSHARLHCDLLGELPDLKARVNAADLRSRQHEVVGNEALESRCFDGNAVNTSDQVRKLEIAIRIHNCSPRRHIGLDVRD